MSFRRACVRAVNTFVSLVLFVVMLTMGAYSGFALWDNRQIYTAARDVQIEMQALKPTLTGNRPSFAQLRAVNPDVKGWLMLDGTGIDYPILQGESNLTYINTDVYGEFSLSGSIFLDCRNSADFSDSYHLVYGHHMAEGRMFGDLDRYKEEAFFRENTTGTLMTAGRVYDLHVLALLIVPASEARVFDVPGNQGTDEVVRFLWDNAAVLADDLPAAGEELQLLALSTCAAEFTDARTVLVTAMSERRE